MLYYIQCFSIFFFYTASAFGIDKDAPPTTIHTTPKYMLMLHVFQVVSVKSSVFIEVILMKPVRMCFACMSTSAFWLNSC